MKNLLILFTLITLFSCSDNNDKIPLLSSYLDVSIDLTVINSDDEDLLNQDNPNSIDIDKIRVFYEIDGELQNMNERHLDAPRMFRVIKHHNEDFYRMRLILNSEETESKPKTIVQWDDNSRETFEAIFDRTINTIIKNKVWLNGELVMEYDQNYINRKQEPTYNISK